MLKCQVANAEAQHAQRGKERDMTNHLSRTVWTGTTTCTNCTKASKICPGHRNMLDLAFRNERVSVIEKVNAKEKARKKEQRETKSTTTIRTKSRSRASSSTAELGPSSQSTSPSSSDYGNDDGSEFNETLTAPRPRAALAPSIVEQGTSYFISKLVAGISGPSHGYFDYLKEICRIKGSHETLSTSMTAAGLAGLANRIKSSQLLDEARHE
ncbi:hypothetical protein EAF04_006188 [Stromatinia cepivora]|nr:hypothetical protein EAF04_006188 [Stromatinia cepivora]